MKVHITFGDINETIEGHDAGDVLRKAKIEAARRAPFLVRSVISNMSDLGFAAEAVKRANAEEKRDDPTPQSAQEFLDWAAERGYMKIVG